VIIFCWRIRTLVPMTTYAEDVRSSRELLYDKRALAVKERLTPFVNKLTSGWRKEKERPPERDLPGSLVMEKDAPVPLSVATEEVRLDPKYFGEAISFYFNGTALCFANTKRRDSPFKLAGEDLEQEFQSYHHTFWLGDISPVAVDQSKWIDLFVDDDNGSVVWRSLPECFVSHVQAQVIPIGTDESSKGKGADGDGLSRQGPSVHSPISVSAQIPTLVFPAVGKKHYVSIVLSDIKGDRLARPVDFMGVAKIEPFIIFDAPFIEIGRRTNVQNSEFPKWPETIKLRPIFSDTVFLRQQHLRMIVMNRDSQEGVLGIGVISLKRAYGEQPMEFSSVLTIQDKPAGHLSGKVHIIMSTPITSSRQHHSPPLSPVPTSPSDLPRKPLPPRPAPAGVVSSPISPGRQKLPDQQDSYTYPVIPLPQLPSLRDTTTHITTSLTATFTSAKQTIPSLMGWFGLEDTSPRPPSEEPHSAPLPGPQPLQQPPPQSREPLIDLGDDRDKGAPVERLMKSETIDDLLA